jgi:hypothetical protein
VARVRRPSDRPIVPTVESGHISQNFPPKRTLPRMHAIYDLPRNGTAQYMFSGHVGVHLPLSSLEESPLLPCRRPRLLYLEKEGGVRKDTSHAGSCAAGQTQRRPISAASQILVLSPSGAAIQERHCRSDLACSAWPALALRQMRALHAIADLRVLAVDPYPYPLGGHCGASPPHLF